MRRPFVLLVFPWLAALGACSSDTDPSLPEARAVEEEAADPPPIAQEPPLVDLLYRTRSRVVVSSRVDNDADAPEHLVDRRADTAWNGASGDLAASMRFDVPLEARVKRIVLVVGYDKISLRGDQFTKNHRIRKIAIEKDGAPVGVFDLDPTDRRPQAIAIDEAGGSFTLRVVETEPGSEPRFREVVVSELEVLGSAPDSALVPAAAPEVRVATAAGVGVESPALRPMFEGAPYTTAEELCAKHSAAAAGQIARAKAENAGDIYYEQMTPACGTTRPEKAVWTLPAQYEVRVLDGIEDLLYVSRLIVKTDRGWFPTNLVLDRDEPGPGCGHSEILETTEVAVVDGAKAPTIRFDYVHRVASWLRLDQSSYEAAARFRVSCVEEGSRFNCRRTTTAATTENLGWVDEGQTTGTWQAVPKRWEWTRTADIDADGSFRLGPCIAPDGGFVRCTPVAERKIDRD